MLHLDTGFHPLECVENKPSSDWTPVVEYTARKRKAKVLEQK